jgi:EAL domain-containing protein (putative c-di-GMP-specific phosphodiesterase class I)
MYLSGLIAHLRTLIAEETLDFVFQPIFDLRSRNLLGYETLMRGPEESPLHTPEQLLRVARDAGLGLALERLACRRALAAFVAARLPGRLFINLSAAMIVDQAATGELLATVKNAGLPPAQLVIEHIHHAEDGAEGLADALGTLAAQGFGLSFDMLDADGTAPQPDFVKLAPAHIRQIQANAPRRQAMEAFLRQAGARGVRVVAEGVEDSRELATLQGLGCDCAQGYLLGRPAVDPARQLSRSVADILIACPRP